MDVHGFKRQDVAISLIDVANERQNSPIRDETTPPPPIGSIQRREYWVVPVGTIKGRVNSSTPTVGSAYILRLDRDVDPPVMKRFKDPATGLDAEIPVSNWRLSSIKEASELSPVYRATEDVFGEISILPQDSSYGRLHCKFPRNVGPDDQIIEDCPVVRALDGRTYPETVTLTNIPRESGGGNVHSGNQNAVVLVTFDATNGRYWIDGVECPQ